MRRAVEQHIGSCDKCARHNIRRTKEDSHLKNIQPPDDVFQIVHMDFWRPMTTSDDGNRYVLVLTDNLSKYVIAEPYPGCTAKTAAKFFMEKYILVHGHLSGSLQTTVLTSAMP
ncbi:unnamed protein product [Rotaria magnacalcarata]|uniref:Integrase catalytic domain-containing protein n=1 Tax=Rotaria magnacalcarata TaxID=392030 RepID=A0A816TCT5_9BILA|nr:unnamed protein product [Rotaria magnacalcarata]